MVKLCIGLRINHATRESIFLFFSGKPGRCIAEVEIHTYFQLPVTACTDQIIQAEKAVWQSVFLYI